MGLEEYLDRKDVPADVKEAIKRDITERKRLEQQLKEDTENLEELVDERTKALRESETRLQAILAGIGDLISIQNRDLDVIWVNQQVKDTYGDVVGKKCYEAYRRVAEKCHNCPVEKAFDEEITVVSEGSSIRLDGQRRHTLLTSSPVRDTEGNIVAVVEMVKDITDRKKLEQQLKEHSENLEKMVEERTAELRESEGRHRGLYESSMDGIASATMDGAIADCNQAFADMLGYTKEEVYQITYREYVPNKWHDLLDKIFTEQILPRGYSDEFEVEAIKKDGTIFPVSTRIWLIKDKEGNPIGRWGIARNITERKRAEEALKESEERYRGLYESSMDGIVSVTLDGNIVECNQALMNMLSYTKENLYNLNYRDLIPRKWHDNLDKINTEQTILRGYSDVIETEVIKKDGTIIPVSIRGWLIKDKEGNPIGMWGIVRDITKHKRAEEAICRERNNLINILDSMEDGVYIVNQNYDIEYANSTIKKEFGLPEERKCYDYFHDREEVCPWCKNPEVFAGKTVHWEWYSSKTNKTYDLIDTPLKNHDGSISKLEIFRDITKRKEMEEKIKAAKERAEHYLDIAGVVILTLNKKGEISLINKKGCEVLQYEDETELIGKNWSETCLPDRQKERVRGIFEALMRGQLELVEFTENPVLTKHGEERLIAWHNSLLYDETGNIIGTLSSGEDITERKQLEEQLKTYIDDLKTSEERYRGLYESSIDGIASIDMLGKFTDCNQAYANMLGYTREELLNLALWDILPSEMVDLSKKIITEQVLPRGYSDEFESIHIKKDGTIFTVSVRVWLIKDQEGNPAGTWGFVRDITERKQLEEQLKTYVANLEASEERYRGLYESSIDGIASVDMSGKFTGFNQAYSDRLGYTKDELLNLSLWDIVPSEAIDISQKIITEQVLPRGYSDTFETLDIKKDGTVLPISVRVWLIKDKEGNPTGMWAIARDIAEQKKLERKLKNYTENLETIIEERILDLRESEERYRKLYESSVDGIFSMDLEGKIIECNQAFAEILGYTKEGLYQLTYRDLMPSKWHDIDVKIFTEQLLPRGFSDEYEKEYLKKDGTIIPVSVRIWLIKDKGDTPTRAWAIVRDITEGKTLERKLKKYTENLEASDERYRGLYESSRDGIVFVGMEENIMECNQAFADMLGYTKEGLYQLTYRDLTPLKWHDMEAKIFTEQLLPRGFSDEYEKEYRKKDGTIVPVSLRIWLIKGKEGKTIGRWAIVRDISERKQMEEKIKTYTESLEKLVEERSLKLKESEERYRQLVELSPDAIVLTSLEGKVTMYNEQAAELFGFESVEETLGQNAFEFVVPKERQHAMDNLRKRIQGIHDVEDIEYTLLKKDGTRFYAELRISSIQDSEGRPQTFINVLRDITERKQMEEKLRESEERYRGLFESSVDGIVSVNVDGMIVDCNQAFVDLLGYTKEELCQLNYLEIIPSKWNDVLNKIREEQLVPQGYSDIFEVELIKKEGTISPVSVRAWGIVDKEGNLAGTWSIVRDITEQKKLKND